MSPGPCTVHAQSSCSHRGGGADALVLAGGTGRRLGGASKPDVVARGARLIDHLLTGLENLRGRGVINRVVVVAPSEVALPDGVLRALEDPPLGGPVAGIGAGLARLSETAGRDGPAPVTAVLTCDAPESWRALPVLLSALQAAPHAPGACTHDGTSPQYLLGVYRREEILSVMGPGSLRDVSVRSVLGRLRPLAVDLGELAPAAHDLDTWPQVHAWDRGSGLEGWAPRQ
ncbi:MAG: NTP transferase domain-containing protein [Actinomyces sp.]|uniref:molybdenum cofactor guanylyltransferase n=1 Tax=Actinomyces sp. TaxID=29317 RepID=UPI0026DC623F|nr:NTP transferase domain-containing protein [Actinomyces sp.]MDO4242300.1 NTP transferase domain-containing protein [Actinomyces sp.]